MDNLINKTPEQIAKDYEFKRELERRAYDVVRCYNPTKDDYIVKWDGTQGFVVPAGKTADLPRYIAINYVKQMTDILITQEADVALELENKKRQARGADKANAKDVAIIQNPIILSLQKREEIAKMLVKGIVKEHGKYNFTATEQKLDARQSQYEKIDDLFVTNLEEEKQELTTSQKASMTIEQE